MQYSQLTQYRNRGWIAYAMLFALCFIAILILPAGQLRILPAFLLVWLLPWIGWISRFPRYNHILEKIIWVGAGLMAVQMLVTLLLHYLPGRFPNQIWLVWVSFLTLMPLAQAYLDSRRDDANRSEGSRGKRESARFPNRISMLVVAALVAIALLLRGPWLGYKEFQGDEAVVMVRAADALVGDVVELFLHQKGPVEILVPMSLWALTGEINEFSARLPFTLANLLSILAIFHLGRRLFGNQAGLYAALLLTLVGFHIAFGRIVQYQSFVVLWGSAALLAAAAYAQSDKEKHWPIYLSVFFLAAGLLAHYDAVLVLPAAGLLIAWSAWRESKIHWGVWMGAIAMGIAVLALFYLPFALSPTFSGTLSYLLNDRVGTESTGQIADVWRMATFYNSTYFVIGLGLFSILGMWALYGQDERFDPVLAYGALLSAVVPLLFYSLIVTDARTHLYTIFPGFCLLAGLGVAVIHDRVQDIGWRWPQILQGGITLWFIVSGVYVFQLFTNGPQEIQRNWESRRPVGYWTTWDEPPKFGLFGFPYQAGWRQAGTLLQLVDGQLYGSNEEQEVTMWYTAHAPRTHCDHYDLFVLAQQVQDEVPYNRAFEDRLTSWGSWGDYENREKLVLFYSPEGEWPNFMLGESSRWLTPDEAARPTTAGEFPTSYVYGEMTELIGYDLDTSQAVPGGQVIVTLHWLALQPFERNFQVFAQLYDPGRQEVVAQFDTAPDCAINPTTRWEPGWIVPDAHAIDLPNEILPGTELVVLVGMYDLLTLDRLSIPDTPSGAVELATVSVGQPSQVD